MFGIRSPFLRGLTGAPMLPGDDGSEDDLRRRALGLPQYSPQGTPYLPPQGSNAPPAASGSKWDNIGSKLSDLAMGLGAAQSFMSGDFADGGALLVRAGSAREQAAKDKSNMAVMTARRDALIKAGIDPDKASVLASDPEALRQTLAPKPEQPTELQKDTGWFNGLSPEDQARARQAIGIIHPPQPQFMSDGQGGGTWMQPPSFSGASATPSAIPHVTDEASYAAIPPGQQYTTPDGHVRVKGGGAGDGTGNFRPSGNPLDAYPYRR